MPGGYQSGLRDVVCRGVSQETAKRCGDHGRWNCGNLILIFVWYSITHLSCSGNPYKIGELKNGQGKGRKEKVREKFQDFSWHCAT